MKDVCHILRGVRFLHVAEYASRRSELASRLWPGDLQELCEILGEQLGVLETRKVSPWGRHCVSTPLIQSEPDVPSLFSR